MYVCFRTRSTRLPNTKETSKEKESCPYKKVLVLWWYRGGRGWSGEFRLWWWYQLFIAVNRNLGIRQRDKYGYGEGEVEKGPVLLLSKVQIPLKLISMVVYIFLNRYIIFYMVFLFDKFKENIDKSKTCKTIQYIGTRQVSKIVKLLFLLIAFIKYLIPLYYIDNVNH